MPVLGRSFCLPLVALSISGFLGACGSPPPAAPTAPQAPVAAAPKETPLDVSPVPEPPGLVLVGRVSKPDAIVAAAGSWTHLPLPAGAELMRSVTEDAVADVVDLSKPVDAAVTLTLSRHGVEPLIAFAITVKSYEQAKSRLGETHRLVAGDNGQLRVQGLSFGRARPSRAPLDRHRRGHDADEDEEGDDDEGDGCVLAPAAQGGRLVCGERAAVDSLAPYLSRTMPREHWSSDIHIELRPEPIRAPLQDLRSTIPILARSLVGSSAAMRDLVDASLGEVIDIVGDAQKLTIDARVAEEGIEATTRFEFQSNRSVLSRALLAERGDSPPAAFWHLPADTDTAFFGRGSDPKLFEHARELLGNMMVEAADAEGMPDAERAALRDLVFERSFALFANDTGVYGKGFDQAAVEKAVAQVKGVKPTDRVGRYEARRVLLEQVVGWHLYQVSDPIAKVGPILKDASALFGRPAFTKWVRSKASGKTLPRTRVVPAPAGVTLPKETVHLEITLPREDIELDVAAPAGKAKKPKTASLKPFVVHVFAVPDGSATWLGIGMDAKLVAQKAAASLASAPDTNTLGKAPKLDALRQAKINGGGLLTMRGLLVLTALDHHRDRSPFALLPGLPSKGADPVIVTGRAEAPSPTAKAGASVGSLTISRAIIEDIVKVAMTAR